MSENKLMGLASAVKGFFGFENTSEMRKEYMELTDKDKLDLAEAFPAVGVNIKPEDIKRLKAKVAAA